VGLGGGDSMWVGRGGSAGRDVGVAVVVCGRW
jgi:hypothetical protein